MFVQLVQAKNRTDVQKSLREEHKDFYVKSGNKTDILLMPKVVKVTCLTLKWQDNEHFDAFPMPNIEVLCDIDGKIYIEEDDDALI